MARAGRARMIEAFILMVVGDLRDLGFSDCLIVVIEECDCE